MDMSHPDTDAGSHRPVIVYVLQVSTKCIIQVVLFCVSVFLYVDTKVSQKHAASISMVEGLNACLTLK
jgi:hypothetical protein